ncbi:MAG TPA: 3-deoxy-7-phosphoheptulonate synthase [Jatrophihabitans sp.]|nr:3-deoxy-7-phosphoheptulonate synthase [Jatrophihabitans sp.]
MDSAPFEDRPEAAAQQPPWDDPDGVARVRAQLAASAPLVRTEDVAALRGLLAGVAAGEALVVQGGDCAEDPDECDGTSVRRKAALLDLLAGKLALAADRPVIRVGRIGGQFCKPRSAPYEQVGDELLPVYRGHMVNRPAPTPEARRPDPLHMLTAYRAAAEVMSHLGWHGSTARPSADDPVWTSHEALLLDYELPLVRRQPDGSLLLASTHWPWIGERTGQLDGAHVGLLAQVANPVAYKLGPRARPEELLRLCERLDPDRLPGRLTFIVRMGATTVAELLPRLVAEVRRAGHPAIWLSDPMHGNTVTAPTGHKTRYLHAMIAEVRAFQQAVRSAGARPGGLHLETTPDPVEECVLDEAAAHRMGANYRSFCDPRLNPEQAQLLAAAWRPDGPGEQPNRTRSHYWRREPAVRR